MERVFTMQRIVLIPLTFAVLIGCHSQLPAAARPQPIVPRLPSERPPDNLAPGDADTVGARHGRLIVDVEDGPTSVFQVRMAPQARTNSQGQQHWEFVETMNGLCQTPCAVDLPRGNALLGFPVMGNPGEIEVELVHIGPEPAVYRRRLSIFDPGSEAAFILGLLGATFGGMSMVTGIAFLPVGLAKDDDGLATAGAITLGVGAALVGVGTLGIVLGAPSYQPGSSVHFPLENPR